MIPQFPTFKKFEIEDIAEVKKLTKKFPPYTEFNIVSLLLWYDIEVAILNNNLVIKMNSYYDDNIPVYSLLGATNINKSLVILLSYSEKNSGDSELILVPESVIKSIKIRRLFDCDEDRDNYDYILSTEKMYNLNSSHDQRQRNLINNFSKKYPEFRSVLLNIKDKKILQDIYNLFSLLHKNNRKLKNHLTSEYLDITRLSKWQEQLDLLSLGIYHDNSLIGLSINELTKNSFAVGLYMKTNLTYAGITATLYKLTGEHLFNRGFKYINIEADLGLPGLRDAKLSRRPVHFLKKYTVRLKK